MNSGKKDSSQNDKLKFNKLKDKDLENIVGACIQQPSFILPDPPAIAG